MARFLVTGGAGFIGSALVNRLVELGHAVRVLDDFSTGFRSNLESCRDRIEVIEGTVAELAVCRAAAQDVDYVLHEAAIPSVQRSVDDPVSSTQANVNGTLNMLLAARDARVKRLVFASSSSVYGESEVLPKVETMREDPLSPYALTKLAGEKYCGVFYRIYGLSTVALRYFNVFGPRQDPHSQYSAVISRFVDAALQGRRPTVYGDGEQSRDFTYVENVVEANLLACFAEAASGMAFNVGTGQEYTLNDLLRFLAAIVGHPIDPIYSEARLGDVRHSQAAIDRARRTLGFEPKVGFKEGLERTVDWFRRSQPLAG
jgi:nucleoside-diphosphate-sugar epimerase